MYQSLEKLEVTETREGKRLTEEREVQVPSGFSVYTTNGKRHDFGDISKPKAQVWENHGLGAIIGLSGNLKHSVTVKNKAEFNYPSIQFHMAVNADWFKFSPTELKYEDKKARPWLTKCDMGVVIDGVETCVEHAKHKLIKSLVCPYD